jgi:hypothetical protein
MDLWGTDRDLDDRFQEGCDLEMWAGKADDREILHLGYTVEKWAAQQPAGSGLVGER